MFKCRIITLTIKKIESISSFLFKFTDEEYSNSAQKVVKNTFLKKYCNKLVVS